MFANLDNNTLLLIVAAVFAFWYLTMGDKEHAGNITGRRERKMSGRSAGRVTQKRDAEVASIMEGYMNMNGYY